MRYSMAHIAAEWLIVRARSVLSPHVGPRSASLRCPTRGPDRTYPRPHTLKSNLFNLFDIYHSKSHFIQTTTIQLVFTNSPVFASNFATEKEPSAFSDDKLRPEDHPPRAGPTPCASC